MLYREDRLADNTQTAIGAVKQRNMCFFDMLWQAVGIDRKAVVHRYDFYLAGGVVLDRMVCAMMTLMHLFGLGTER